MNNIENLLISLLKEEKINTKEFFDYLKELKEFENKAVNFNIESKKGLKLHAIIPKDFIKEITNEIPTIIKKENGKNLDGENIIKNILKYIV